MSGNTNKCNFFQETEKNSQSPNIFPGVWGELRNVSSSPRYRTRAISPRFAANSFAQQSQESDATQRELLGLYLLVFLVETDGSREVELAVGARRRGRRIRRLALREPAHQTLQRNDAGYCTEVSTEGKSQELRSYQWAKKSRRFS